LMPVPLIIAAVILILTCWLLWSQVIGAGWWPTPMTAVRRMLELAELKEDDILYDLGSGDGRIVIEAAKRYGVRGVGIEVDPLRVAVSRLNVRRKGVQSLVTIVHGDLFKQSLEGASVVTLFLTQKTNQKLKQRLLELRNGARIVTHTWTLEGWTPVLADRKERVYLYVVNFPTDGDTIKAAIGERKEKMELGSLLPELPNSGLTNHEGSPLVTTNLVESQHRNQRILETTSLGRQ